MSLVMLDRSFEQGRHALFVPPGHRVNVLLTADTPRTVAVPEGAGAVSFYAGGAEFYVAYDTAAAVPSTDIEDGSAPDWSPAARDLYELSPETLSLVAPTDTRVQLTFWRVKR